MKTSLVLTTALSIFCFNAYSQIGSQIGRSILENVASRGNIKKAGGLVARKMSDSRKDYDQALFNYAVSLSDNAGLFESQQQYKKHERLLLDVMKGTDNKTNTPLENAEGYLDAGELFYSSNKYSSAEASFKAAIFIYESQIDTGGSNAVSFKKTQATSTNKIDTSAGPLYARALSNLGLLYHTTGRYNIALTYTEKALELRKKIFSENNASYAASVNNLAVLYKDMGRYNESEGLIATAISINEKTVGKESVPYALSLNNQAMLYQAMGRDKEAEPILKQSIEIAGNTLKDKSTNYVRLMMNEALLYQDMGQYTQAEEIYLKAIKIKEGKLGTNHPDYAYLLNELASLYILMGKMDKVEELLKKSTAIYKKNFGENHPSYASSISNLGNFYRITGKLTEAEPLLKQALEIRKSTLGENHLEYNNSQESIGLLRWQQGKLDEAKTQLKQVQEKNMTMINSYFSSLSESEKGKFWDKLRPKLEHFYSFAAFNYATDPTLAGDMYTYQLNTKALLLSSSNKIKQQILSGTDEGLKKDYLNWLDQKENLARLYTLSKAELADEKVNLDSLERATNQNEKQLSQRSQIFSSGYLKSDVTFSQIVPTLKDGEAAIEIIQFPKFNKVSTDTICYAALILTKETATNPKLVLLENGNQLEKKFFNYYRNAVKQKMKDDYSYDQYWGRIDKELTKKTLIHISMDGIYNQINLNTLADANGKYLLESKSLEILTNTKELLNPSKSAAGNNNAVLMGFPDYGTTGSIVKLPGTKVELENIKKALTANHYSVKIYTGADASEATVKSLKSPKLLHIATHGFFLPEKDSEGQEKVFGIASDKSGENPLLRSGLMLAGAEQAVAGKSENGILTAYEVMNLLLDNTEIVVLSACETGLGDVKNGEGVYGLQRAFEIAGAKAVVMSLWKVNDEATQQLMSSFYKNYSISNNKTTAFRNAQLEIKTKFKDPYYWGAFIMAQ